MFNKALNEKQEMDAEMLKKDPWLFYSKIAALTAGAFLLGRMSKN